MVADPSSQTGGGCGAESTVLAHYGDLGLTRLVI